MKTMLGTLMDAFKNAYDSVVRTYSPMIVGAIVGAVAGVMGVPVPEEVEKFIVLLVSVVTAMLWYLIVRLIEVIRGKASPLLGLGLTRSEPQYGNHSDPTGVVFDDNITVTDPVTIPGDDDDSEHIAYG